MSNDLPIATYRVQLTASCGFDAAAAIAPYLARLGVSHLYASPYLRAAAGSTHGYDVVDHATINPELGGAESHRRMCGALADSGLSQLVDIVPNHMGISGAAGARDGGGFGGNAWWWDVLKQGPASRYADYFDIDWEAPEARLHGKVLLPILGEQFGSCIEEGQIRIEQRGDEPVVRYFDHLFPIAAGSLDEIGGDPERISADANLLERVLRRQHYRLAWWRTAAQELNYRRFFDVNELIGVRVEEPRVFEHTHRGILRWVSDGCATGLRVDHPDGLRDPTAYFHRLREAAPKAWIIAEKILGPDEPLPDDWPIDGTTGYEFLNRVNGLFVDPAGEAAMTRFYQEFTGEPADYPTVLRDKKELVLQRSFGGELNRLTHIAVEICESRRRYRDYTRSELNEALRAMVVCFDLYRSYVRPGAGRVRGQDRQVIEQAAAAAQSLRPDLHPGLFELVTGLLLLRLTGEKESEFVLRFQQLTGPAMAKGAEDTAFYCYNRLVSLNEVGGDPARWGLSPQRFHAACIETHRRWPRTLLTTSTHDTKRGEDVRARLNVLSEVSDRWAAAVRQWSGLSERHKTRGMPDRNAEYLLYQTLIGAWPIDPGRAAAYMTKAAREAKAHTSWTEPNAAYEDALTTFVERVIADEQVRCGIEAFVREVARPGWINSLAQTLIKLTAPGVPDIYQGAELWDLNLVDPDNRRPVDFERRWRLLDEVSRITPRAALTRIEEGLPKLLLIQRALKLRRSTPEVFGPGGAGEYRPLHASGAESQHILVFMRGGRIVTIVPRLTVSLSGDWRDTALELPVGHWKNQINGDEVEGEVAIADLLREFPVALLLREGD